MRTLYSLQNTDDKHNRDRDVRILNALTLYTTVEAVQLADYNDLSFAAPEDKHLIDDDDDDLEEGEEEEYNNDDATIAGTSKHTAPKSTVATSVTILYIFEVSTSISSVSLSIQAPLALGAFGQDILVLLDKTMHYSRSDVPSLELKISLQYL